ncbi:MAG: aconitate hydratase AcnA [Thermomicrobiales bacterium]
MDPAPIPVTPDPFGARATLSTPFGETVTYYNLQELQNQGLADLASLPFTVRIFLENVLRHAGGEFVSNELVQQLAAWKPRKAGESSGMELPFLPGRVILQDFTGVPAVVDLAAMRDAVARAGGDVTRINPLVPVDLVIDHSVQVDRFGTTAAFGQNVEMEYQRNQERYELLRWAQQSFQNFRVVPPGTGIVHQVNIEYLAPVIMTKSVGAETVAFPDTLVGTDSHTTMVNALGVLGWGVGGIEAEAVMLGQPLYLLEPEVVGVRLVGALPEGSTATDLVLAVTEMLRKLGVVGRFVEFCGAGLSNLPLPDRATISNMAPEYGATAAIFPVDEVTLDYLRLTGRSAERIALVEAYCKAQGLFRTDETPEPMFNELVELDLGKIVPSVAGPRRPQDRLPLGTVQDALRTTYPHAFGANGSNGNGHEAVEIAVDGVNATIDNGAVVIAAITSCTNTSNPSVMLGAGLVARKAVELGLDVPHHVKTSLAPGSQVVTRYLTKAGLLPYLEALGFHVVGYGCTTCIGNSGPLPEPVAKAIDENELVVSAVLSGNRNFEGRIHAQVRAAFLASPPLVVAYALAGTVDLDLANDPIGKDPNGSPIFLRDIWPTLEEVQNAIAEGVDPAMFREEYAVVFAGDERWQQLDVPTGSVYDWKSDSTYVQEPPFFQGAGLDAPLPTDITGARVLALLGDSVTTDHISPAGNIAKSSPAGGYLVENGVTPLDFNSYGARRGNHEVMIRGTFANIRLRNQLTPGKEGNHTRYLPMGEEMSIYDASLRYQADHTPLIVIGGKEYGTGSSRDWAAKGTLLLGVKAVLVESFERIHRSNLVGMGVLPLQFLPGQNAASLGLTGEETFDILGVETVTPRQALQVRATGANGAVTEFEAIARIDSPVEIEYFRNGGILQTVLKRLAQPSA